MARPGERARRREGGTSRGVRRRRLGGERSLLRTLVLLKRLAVKGEQNARGSAAGERSALDSRCSVSTEKMGGCSLKRTEEVSGGLFLGARPACAAASAA